MSFQQGGGLGRGGGSVGAGGGHGRGVSHQMHTRPPRPITIVFQEEVKAEAAPQQMSQFVRLTPEAPHRRGDGTGDEPRPPPPPPHALPSLPLAPFGARTGPITPGKVIQGRTPLLGPSSGWISVPRPRVPFVS